MWIPVKYNVRYLFTRWKSTAMTAMTFALVVATFVIVMSLAQGIERALCDTGDPMNVLVMRQGAQSESQSQISLEQYRVALGAPGIARNAAGEPLVAPELLTLVNRPRLNGKTANVQVRGVHANSYLLRPNVRLVEGRMPRPGLREAMVPRSISNRFQGFKLGDQPRLGRGPFTIVGIFDAQGTAYDSEVWADVQEIKQEFDRINYSSVAIRAASLEAVRQIQDYMAKDKRLKLMTKDEATYYAEQTKTAKPIKAFAAFLAFTMSIGACFAGMNTMYANVANRVREIGTLRILGFSRAAILACFLIESVCLALLGGALGCVLAMPINGLATGTSSFVTFSEIVFYFAITPQLMMRGMTFAALMGLIGGFMPAWTASRQPVLAALRQA